MQVVDNGVKRVKDQTERKEKKDLTGKTEDISMIQRETNGDGEQESQRSIF